MNKTCIYTGVASAVLIALNSAYAEDKREELEAIEVVGSVVKSGKVEYLSPKSVNTIDSRQIADMAVSQLDAALRYESGTSAQTYGADLDDSDWLKIRGFDATVTLDGSSFYKGGYSGWNPDLYGFETIEIIKGADSLTYGSAKTGGLINLVSKRPTQQPQGEFKAKIGNRSERGLSLDISDSAADNLRYRLVGNYNKKHGETNGTWLERYYFAPSLTWDISSRSSLTLLASLQKDVGVPTTSFYPLIGTLDTSAGTISHHTNLGDPTTDYMDRKEYSVGYEFKHDFGGALIYTQTYRFNADDRRQLSGYYGWVSAFPIIQQRSLFVDVLTRNHTFDNRLSKTWHFDGGENTLLGGIEYKHNRASGKYGYGSGNALNALAPTYAGIPEPNVNPYEAKQRQLGFYLQDQLNIANWRLFAGLRHDRARGDSDTFGKKDSYRNNETSYSGGMMYVAENGLSPYFSYSESFEPVVGNDGQGKRYEPLKGKQYETGIKYLPSFIDGKFSVAYFHLKEENGLVQTGAITTQAGKQRSRGVEVNGDFNLTDNITIALAYTYTRAEQDKTDGTEVRKPLIPRHTASVRTGYTFKHNRLDGLLLGAGFRYIGTSNDEIGNPGYKLPAVTLWDVMLKYPLAKNWVLQANISNLTNKKYLSGCYYSCYYGEGRKVTAEITYKW